jgi:hypothetical protein
VHCGCDYKTVLDVDCSMIKFIFDSCYEIRKFSNRYIIMGGGGVDVAESRGGLSTCYLRHWGYGMRLLHFVAF